MSRPDYPNCVMTPGVMQGVRERQQAYDKDPAEYERQEREEEEGQRQLAQAEAEAMVEQQAEMKAEQD